MTQLPRESAAHSLPPPTIRRCNVVLQARVIAALTQEELGDFKTVQPVEAMSDDSAATIVDCALEIADDLPDRPLPRDVREACPDGRLALLGR